MTGLDLAAGTVTCASCGVTEPLPCRHIEGSIVALPALWASGSVDGGPPSPLCPDCRGYEGGPMIEFNLRPRAR
jgi:hypothetical protein